MAIINPSKTFTGSEMNRNIFGQVLKSDTRFINFRDQKIKAEGVYLFILPPYKRDNQGNGVWYHVMSVRDNVGIDTKEKFSVQKNCPFDYFESRAKLFMPEWAKPVTIKKDGKDQKQYQAFGRKTTRVLFNTALYSNPNAGAHVLEVPQSGCASVVDEWSRGKGPDGTDNPMLNQPGAFIPVHFKLDVSTSGQPWKVVVQAGKACALPNELCDTDYLYNLEDCILYPSKEELIEKIKKFFPSDIVSKCLQGYTDSEVNISFANTTPVTGGMTNIPPTDSLPQLSAMGLAPLPALPNLPAPAGIPKASNSAIPTTNSTVAGIPKPSVVSPAFIAPPVPSTPAEHESNPMSGATASATGGFNAADALAFLRSSKPA